MKQHKRSEPVFHSTLQFFYDCSMKECSEAVGVKEMGEGTAMARFCFLEQGVANIIRTSDKYSVPLFCHELLHFVIQQGRLRGFQPTESGEEFYTYLFEYYMHLYVNEVIKKKKEKKGRIILSKKTKKGTH